MKTAELESRVHGLETARLWPSRRANLAGVQATQGVAHSGTWSVVDRRAEVLAVGIFLGMAVAKS
ncbi:MULTISPECIES: hypothetical protein [unclassified Streptomyces]|uniref:hypothetical protein n=1 Tax=unclassified Streptomyces TaxID=2593676 RepID=UPI0033A0A474